MKILLPPNTVIDVPIIKAFLPGGYATVRPVDKPLYQSEKPDAYATWEKAILAGKSYLTGDNWTLTSFLQAYRMPMRPWQQLAYTWAREHPQMHLIVETNRYADWRPGGYIWHIGQRGEYVEFALPHQDYHGERNFISRNGKSMIKVNDD